MQFLVFIHLVFISENTRLNRIECCVHNISSFFCICKSTVSAGQQTAVANRRQNPQLHMKVISLLYFLACKKDLYIFHQIQAPCTGVQVIPT